MHFVSELQICPIFAQPFNLHPFNYQPSPVAFLLSDNFYIIKIYLVSCIMVMVCNTIVLFEDCSSCFLCFFLRHLVCSAVLFFSIPEVWPTYFLGHSALGILYAKLEALKEEEEAKKFAKNRRRII